MQPNFIGILTASKCAVTAFIDLRWEIVKSDSFSGLHFNAVKYSLIVRFTCPPATSVALTPHSAFLPTPIAKYLCGGSIQISVPEVVGLWPYLGPYPLLSLLQGLDLADLCITLMCLEIM